MKPAVKPPRLRPIYEFGIQAAIILSTLGLLLYVAVDTVTAAQHREARRAALAVRIAITTVTNATNAIRYVAGGDSWTREPAPTPYAVFEGDGQYDVTIYSGKYKVRCADNNVLTAGFDGSYSCAPVHP